MALKDFWVAVRRRALLIAPSVPANKPNAARTHRSRTRGHVWLTPACVAGFNPADFAFLPAEELHSLQSHVNAFLAVANTVPISGRVTAKQAKEGFRHFWEIVDIMAFEKYEDPDAFEIGKRLEQAIAGKLPRWVRAMRFRTGIDSIGDPAIWIFVELEDRAAQRHIRERNVGGVETLLTDALQVLNVPLWPFMRFRSTSGEKEAQRIRLSV